MIEIYNYMIIRVFRRSLLNIDSEVGVGKKERVFSWKEFIFFFLFY